MIGCLVVAMVVSIIKGLDRGETETRQLTVAECAGHSFDSNGLDAVSIYVEARQRCVAGKTVGQGNHFVRTQPSAARSQLGQQRVVPPQALENRLKKARHRLLHGAVSAKRKGERARTEQKRNACNEGTAPATRPGAIREEKENGKGSASSVETGPKRTRSRRVADIVAQQSKNPLTWKQKLKK